MSDAKQWEFLRGRSVIVPTTGEMMLNFRGPHVPPTAPIREEADNLIKTFRAGPDFAEYKRQLARRADAQKEAADARRELEVAEKEFRDGQGDEIEQGKLDIALEVWQNQVREVDRRIKLLDVAVADAKRNAEQAYRAAADAVVKRIQAAAAREYDAALADLVKIIAPALTRLQAAAALKTPVLPPVETAIPAEQVLPGPAVPSAFKMVPAVAHA